jgi:hypothetical protein
MVNIAAGIGWVLYFGPGGEGIFMENKNAIHVGSEDWQTRPPKLLLGEVLQLRLFYCKLTCFLLACWDGICKVFGKECYIQVEDLHMRSLIT